MSPCLREDRFKPRDTSAVTSTISLLPLVSLSPHDFHDPARDADRVEPDDWPAYWRASLAESGIDELELSPLAFSCVDARSLTRPSTLSRILSAHAPEIDVWVNAGAKGPTGALLDQISTLSGGIALFLDGEPFVEPGCCASLDDLSEWAALTELTPLEPSVEVDVELGVGPGIDRGVGPAERTVWAGHDLWSPRAHLDATGAIVIRRVGDGYNHAAVVETVVLDPTSLANAIETTRASLVTLAMAISGVLGDRMDPRKARKIACHLAGIDESASQLSSA